MRGDCIKAVSQALGRQINQAEAKKIEQKISEQKRLLAVKDRQAYLAMSETQRLTEAAKLAAESIKAEAIKKQQRIGLTVMAHERIKNYLENQNELMMDSIDRMIAPKLDGKDNTLSAETKYRAIYNENTRQLSDKIESFGPQFLGLIQNNQAMVAVYQELRGKDSGIPEAKKFAQELTTIFDGMRQRFNAAGGAIGDLSNWFHPQAHSSYLVYKAGKEAWKNTIMPLLDRASYVKDNGNRMNDDELGLFLDKAYLSIVYDGKANDAPVNQGRSGMRANRGSAHRQLHFKDADSYLKYHAQFAEKSLMATIVGHINQLSKDIAMVETFGPNPDLQLKVWLKKAYQEGAEAGLSESKLNRNEVSIQNLYDEVAGKSMPVTNQSVARFMSATRNYLNIRLGSAVFTSFADDATAVITAKALNMNGWSYISNQLKALSSEDARKQARSLGLGLDTMLFSINRFGQEDLANGLTSRIASAVIRSSGLSFLTEARRQGFGVMMMHGIGDLVSKHLLLTDLHAGDNRLLLSKGITQQDWDIWRMAKQEEFNGEKVLTPASILAVTGIDAKAKQEAADRLMGAILEETGMAIIEPGARERAMTHGKLQHGSVLGELGLSVLQFKSFPIAMMTRHWRRAMQMDANGKAVYLAALLAGTTIAGALAIQLNEVANGRDPLDMTTLTFWGRSILKGGSLGFYGDFLQSQSSQHGSSFIAGMLGPSLGFLEEMLNLTQGNAIQYINGDDTHVGAEALKALKGLTPGSSLWYTKAILDHWIFQNWQESLSPGYLNRMTTRAQREFKQQYYWKPGTGSPQRSPDLSRVAGD